MMRFLRFSVCILVSVLALVSVAYRVTWDDLLAAFFQYKSFPLLVLLLYTFLIRIPPALRLQRLLPVSFPLALRTILLGCGLNNILPGRAGEIGRAHFLFREGRIEVPRAVRAIFWERLFDVNMLLLVSCVAALLLRPPLATEAVPVTVSSLLVAENGTRDVAERSAAEGDPGRLTEAVAYGQGADRGSRGSDVEGAGEEAGRARTAVSFFRFSFLAGVLAVWVLLFLMYRYPQMGIWMVRRVPFRTLGLVRSFRLFAYRFLDHVRADMTVRLVRGMGLTTGLTWVGYFGTTWLTIRLVAGLAVPMEGILLVFAVSHLTYVMPAAPGSIGLYEWAWVYALGQFGVPVAEAFAAGLTCHMVQFIPMTIFSIAILARSQMGLHLRGLSLPEPVELVEPAESPESAEAAASADSADFVDPLETRR